MDKLDMEILKILEANGRESHEEISRKLHISRPAIHQRVNKLESEGYIKGYKAIVDWSKIGQAIKAYIYIKILSDDFNKTAREIASIQVPNVVIEECHRLAGEWCLVIKIRGNTPNDITNLIDTMWKIKGVKETSTTFTLCTVLEHGM